MTIGVEGGVLIRAFALVWTAFWLAAALLVGWFFHFFYWRWRDCFNSEGKCFVPEHGVTYDRDASGLAFPLVGCLVAAGLGLIVLFRSKTSQTQRPK